MSKIPKLPTISKENRFGQFHNRPISRTIANGLSDVDKKNLITNHTRPLRNGPPVSAAAPRIKRSATAPSSTTIPNNVTKVEKRSTVAPKIPPYDFKARFNDLLEKHKKMKSEFTDLKDKHLEVSDEYEKIKETFQSCSNERDILKANLSVKTLEYDEIKVNFDVMKTENEDLQRKTKLLEEVTFSLKQKSFELDQVQTDLNSLRRRHSSLQDEAEALRVLTDQLKKKCIEYDKLKLDFTEAQENIIKYKTDSEALQNILASMYKEQRDLRNAIQDLKGNIRVYCRIRPPLSIEVTKPLFNLNVVDACSIEVEKIELLNSARKTKPQLFTFDGIFTPHASQEDVFAEVSSMVQSALDGYNVCIFAYGQTGSGKTYTMEGGCGTEQYGIIPRAFNMIFTCMEDLKRMGWELTIKASFLEIYNEVIYDLLNPSKDQENHEIKMVNSKGGDVYVSNLKEEEVKSSHEFIRLMIFAQRNRQTAATLNNERSSRSHSVAQIKIAAINEKRKEKYTSNLNLVDLAGSESGKTTQRMDETKHINRSLSELSKVILSLQTNQMHIPYRNSKLTHLLMPSLGGNSKTLMLVNINQFDECFSETLNSLRFATKVNNCRVVKAKKNLCMVDT
ncbi:kinesin-like protein Ncd [Bombyx mori]|uniref:Kinesin-like protein 14A n=1 Tax=Bombyx mori TaxID=7091 RepID=A1E130_BOMMO|nr:kinesin-like protein Ncd [Bombyx mori]ABK92269.1 kinesin-like protein 14A [Bombyx mori]